jgi:diadenosine tetraphosphate (Ap4A) HIT family hydrolase
MKCSGGDYDHPADAGAGLAGRSGSQARQGALSPVLRADPDQRTPLADLLSPGQTRFVAVSSKFAAMPTFGCFVPGYLLIVPRVHVLTFGQLGAGALAEAQEFIAALAERLGRVYGLPLLGFEYGLAAVGVRRVEHAHWHLLPSEVQLAWWLDGRLPGRRIGSVAELPNDRSYIAVRSQDAALHLYDVHGPLQADQRIRLRRVVAALDPRVDDAAWDWAEHQGIELIRQSLADLGGAR